MYQYIGIKYTRMPLPRWHSARAVPWIYFLFCFGSFFLTFWYLHPNSCAQGHVYLMLQAVSCLIRQTEINFQQFLLGAIFMSEALTMSINGKKNKRRWRPNPFWGWSGLQMGSGQPCKWGSYIQSTSWNQRFLVFCSAVRAREENMLSPLVIPS